MGLGQFGGGAGVTRYLVERGATVTLTDREPAEKLAKPLASIADLVDSGRVRLALGGHAERRTPSSPTRPYRNLGTTRISRPHAERMSRS
jgi:hypothetical protein